MLGLPPSSPLIGLGGEEPGFVYDLLPIPASWSVREVEGRLVAFSRAPGDQSAAVYPFPDVNVCVVEKPDRASEFLYCSVSGSQVFAESRPEALTSTKVFDAFFLESHILQTPSFSFSMVSTVSPRLVVCHHPPPSSLAALDGEWEGLWVRLVGHLRALAGVSPATQSGPQIDIGLDQGSGLAMVDGFLHVPPITPELLPGRAAVPLRLLLT